MSKSLRIIFAAIALSAVAVLVWLPWEPTVDAGRDSATSAGSSAASSWLPGMPVPELRSGGKLALLVGIDEYPDPIGNLRGCVEDVDLAAALLERRFGFAREGIVVLRNQDATHENIVRAFDEWLIQRATPETQVLIWFSGHGSRVPDEDDEEELGGMDNTFLAWDSRTEHKGEYDLVDDEFRSLLAALTDVTSQVTVITDSCHSGTLMRGGAQERPLTRSIPPGENPVDPALIADFWPAQVAPFDAGGAEPDLSRYVHLAACSPSQLAFEHRYEDEDGERRYQGALSFFLLDAMGRCEPTISWRRLSEAVRVRLNSRYHSQVLWSEGALERRILGGGFEPPLEGYTGHVKGAIVTLEGGCVQRLYPGTELEIFGLLDDGSEALGRVVVQEARDFTADAAWDGGIPESLADGTTVRAVVVRQVSGAQVLYVYADPLELEDLLPGSVEVVSDEADADILLRRLEDGQLAIYDAHGNLIWAAGREFWNIGSPDDERSPEEQLAAVLEVETSYRALLSLEEEPGRFKIEACFQESSKENLIAQYGSAQPHYDIATDTFTAQGGSSETRFRILELEVTNLEDEDLCVTVISLDETRARTQIFPDVTLGRDNVIAAHQSRRIQVGLFVPETWDEGRPMRDRYLVIATRDYANFAPLLGKTFRNGPQDPMPQPLQNALAGPRTRGMGSSRVAEPNWGIVVVDVFVYPSH